MGLFGWVLWICMTNCAVVSETKITPDLTAEQCLHFLEFYHKLSLPNEIHCISPRGKRYSTYEELAQTLEPRNGELKREWKQIEEREEKLKRLRKELDELRRSRSELTKPRGAD